MDAVANDLGYLKSEFLVKVACSGIPDRRVQYLCFCLWKLLENELKSLFANPLILKLRLNVYSVKGIYTDRSLSVAKPNVINYFAFIGT
jgi:hypothetical protein